MTASRPGGRSARTKAAVFDATAALLAERNASSVTMVDVATRAGVAATSLYRRWGDVRTLLMEVAVERLMQDSPLPDTGTLDGDLRAWGATVAASLRSREGSAFFRVLVATAPLAQEDRTDRAMAVSRRLSQIHAMLERARARGEHPPSAMEVTDHLLAPLYVRALFGIPADASVAGGLVDRLLAAPRSLGG